MRPYLDKKSAVAIAHDLDIMRKDYGDEFMSVLTDIHKIANRPRISSNDRLNLKRKHDDGTPRSYWVPIINRIHNISNLKSLVTELAHPI